VLKLASETSQAWTEGAVAHIDEILLDHAHCEKKAAGSAVRLLFRYPEHGFLLEPISALAREELEHFERVLGLMRARGLEFRRQKPSAYAGRLQQLLRPGEPNQLLDWLLIASLIEARSCERFQLLAAAGLDEDVASLYSDLLASEARHHRLYVELACGIAADDVVRRRLDELAEAEAAILRKESGLFRLHS
jgi:tRNA-(ms[2]io[6]A)-hydroxylase